jgi:hypothetical protein
MQFVDYGHLYGTAELTMPDGELLQGEYSIVAAGSISASSISASKTAGVALGRAGCCWLLVGGTGGDAAMAGRGQGQALLYGNHGTSVQCEFANSNMTGHGYGTCESSKGGQYRMAY